MRTAIPMAVLLLMVAAAFTTIPATPAGAQRTYVGTRTCAGCHSDKFSDSSDYQGFAAFGQTMHQKIHLRPTPESVVIDRYFSGDSVLRAYIPQVAIPGKDTLLISLSKRGSDYYIGMRIADGDSLPPMKVAYTYGGNGWIQRYLLEVNGSYYVAPFQYILPGYRRRIDSMGTFYFLDMKRWLSLDPSSGLAKFYSHSSNVFREQSWERNCAPCHVTGPQTTINVNGTDTSWANLWVGRVQGDSARIDQNVLVGCESCHGPGSEHAMTQAPGTIVNPRRWPMTREATDQKLDLCGNCHYRIKSKGMTFNYPYNESTGSHYVPGESLADYIKDKFTGMNTWPDRVTSYAHHQSGQDFLRSRMYEAHAFPNGCWDCHNVHQSRSDLPYQLKRNFYSMKKGEGCLECHAEKADVMTYEGRTVNAHTKHPQGVSQCVNCHMTKTASIGFMDIPGNDHFEFSKRLYEFSNHSFRVLPPSMTMEYASAGINIGMMNTCAESCHRNGRGSRNSSDTMPAAPSFGIYDNNIGLWNERTDLQLADTLMRHYQRLFPTVASVARSGSHGTTGLIGVSPNPIRSSGRIEYRVASGDRATVSIFSSSGSRLFTLEQSVEGTHAFEWNGTDASGSRLPSGAYYVRVEGASGSAERRVVIER